MPVFTKVNACGGDWSQCEDIIVTCLLHIFQSSFENGPKSYVCVMIYPKTKWQVNWVDNSNVPLSGSKAVISLFLRVPWLTILWRWNARYDDTIMTFVWILFLFLFFFVFFGGGRVFKLLNIYFFFIIYCQDLWLYITSQNLIVSTVGTVREDLSLHGIRGKVIQV